MFVLRLINSMKPRLIDSQFFFFLNLNLSSYLVSFSLHFPNSLSSLFIPRIILPSVNFVFIAFGSIIHQPGKHTPLINKAITSQSLVEAPSKDQKTWKRNTTILAKRLNDPWKCVVWIFYFIFFFWEACVV